MILNHQIQIYKPNKHYFIIVYKSYKSYQSYQSYYCFVCDYVVVF